METRGGSTSMWPEQWEGRAVGWDEIFLGEIFHRQRTENWNWNRQWCLEVSARNCPYRYPCGHCNDNELHGEPWTIWQDNAVAGTWMGEKNHSSVVQETIHCCGHMADDLWAAALHWALAELMGNDQVPWGIGKHRTSELQGVTGLPQESHAGFP